MSVDPRLRIRLRFDWPVWLFFCLLLLGVPVQRAACQGDTGPGLSATVDRAEAAAYFTNLPLITHEGAEIHFYRDLLDGRVVLLTGFYVNCTSVSPQQNLVLSRLQVLLGDRLGKEVGIITLSVDPKRDTPEKVADYAKVFRPRPGWTFLTGKPENIDWVNYKLGQFYEDPELHRGLYLLGNLKTGLWKKLKTEITAKELLVQIEEMLSDSEARE